MPKKAQKSSPKRSPKARERAAGPRYGISRTWKRANPLTFNHDHLPASAIPKVLSLTGFRDLKSLCAEISKHQRYHIAESLQKRLIRLFNVQINASATNEPIDIKVGRKSYKLPYPFLADDSAEWEFQIADIFFKHNKRAGALEIGIFVYVEVPELLRAKRKKDEQLCALLANGVDLHTATENEKAIISSWLIRSGMKSSDANRVLDESTDLFDDCCWQISYRIASLVDLVGSLDLINDIAKAPYLSADDTDESFVIH